MQIIAYYSSPLPPHLIYYILLFCLPFSAFSLFFLSQFLFLTFSYHFLFPPLSHFFFLSPFYLLFYLFGFLPYQFSSSSSSSLHTYSYVTFFFSNSFLSHQSCFSSFSISLHNLPSPHFSVLVLFFFSSLFLWIRDLFFDPSLRFILFLFLFICSFIILSRVFLIFSFLFSSTFELFLFFLSSISFLLLLPLPLYTLILFSPFLFFLVFLSFLLLYTFDLFFSYQFPLSSSSSSLHPLPFGSLLFFFYSRYSYFILLTFSFLL